MTDKEKKLKALKELKENLKDLIEVFKANPELVDELLEQLNRVINEIKELEDN
jgi:ABC-type transporter Mla subunit MlaD